MHQHRLVVIAWEGKIISLVNTETYKSKASNGVDSQKLPGRSEATLAIKQVPPTPEPSSTQSSPELVDPCFTGSNDDPFNHNFGSLGHIDMDFSTMFNQKDDDYFPFE